MAAETGVIMIIFLDEACARRQRENRLQSLDDLREAIIEGAALRVRPKIMTASAIMLGLLPIMWSQGTGADVMKRIAAPMIGGIGDGHGGHAADSPRLVFYLETTEPTHSPRPLAN